MNIDVDVRRGDESLRWARKRPPRRTPAGCAGVVFQGEVFPVYQDSDLTQYIQLEDQSFDPDECDFWPFLEPMEYANSATIAVTRWHVETNVYGHYLVFDGSSATLDQVRRLLAKSGIGIRRDGASIRPADDGYHYDWFIRLDLEDTRDEVVSRVQGILTGQQTAVAVPADPEDDPLNGLSPRLATFAREHGLAQASESDLVEWLGDLFDQLSKMYRDTQKGFDEKIDTLETELDAAHRAKAEALAGARTTLRDSESRCDSLEAELKVHRAEENEVQVSLANIAALETQISRLKADFQASEELLLVAQIEEGERASLQREIHDLQSELMTARERSEAPMQKLSGGRVRRQPLALAKRCLETYHRLQFVADSAEEILAGFPDPTTLFGILDELDDGEAVPSCAIRAASGWREVRKHIATGDRGGCADMGRVYYRFIEQNHLDVVVHVKKNDAEQQRLFSRLSSI